ncbi:hypothetical protein SDC9_81110 [bioreactor metagenome]|uniref:Uncharacterized protein n=1 Tax=bioreactor metagenome TaxID=1076179 RepID=A0A644Z985_9ZZZZ
MADGLFIFDDLFFSVHDRLVDAGIDSSVISNFGNDFFFVVTARIIHISQDTVMFRQIDPEVGVCRHMEHFQMLLLTILGLFDERALFTRNDKAWTFLQAEIAGFDGNFLRIIEEVQIEVIIESAFAQKLSDVISDAFRIAEVGKDLVDCMAAMAVQVAVDLRKTCDGFRNFRSEIVVVHFNFQDIPQHAALDHFLDRQEVRVESAVLVALDEEIFFFRQGEQFFGFCGSVREGFFNQRVLAFFQGHFAILIMEV